MMTLTGEWNAIINAFPAFAGQARVAAVNSGCRRVLRAPRLR